MEVFIIETYVGETNASVATLEAIKETNPDYVIKFGCVGGSYSESKKGDVIIPLGFFHRGGWITKNKVTHIPTSNAATWDSVFGEKDYQIQESRNNLGGMPYYFPANDKLIDVFKKTLDLLNMTYVTAFIGGGNMWMTDQSFLDNVAENLLPGDSIHKRFVSDMESYSIAHACYILKKPFLGCYVVTSNDYFDELYDPLLVPVQMERLIPYALQVMENLTKS